jgi:hypothetical protein
MLRPRSGVYIYDAKVNALDRELVGDFRTATGTQPFVKDAAVNLIYVSDLSKTGDAASSESQIYTAADVGFIAQNVLSLLRFRRASYRSAS